MDIKIITKRFIALCITVALVLPCLFAAVDVSAADSTSAFEVISGRSADKELSKSGVRQLEWTSTGLSAIWDDSYGAWSNVYFGETGAGSISLTIVVPETGQGFAKYVEIRIDDPNSEPIGIVQIKNPMGSKIPIIVSGNLNKIITGLHTVYITSQKLCFGVNNFQFYEPTPDAVSYQAYTGDTLYKDADSETNRSAFLLKQLGMLTIDGDKFNGAVGVTRAEFAEAIYGIYEDAAAEKLEEEAVLVAGDSLLSYETGFEDVAPENEYAKEISYLSKRGIMNGDGYGKFEPNIYVKKIDAITALVRILDYSREAEALGGYPDGYYRIAAEKKIIGKNESVDGVLTRKEFVDWLINTLEAEYLMPISVKDGYTKHDRYERILTLTQKLSYNTGMVEATYFSGLTMPDTDVAVNEIVIDGERYKVGTTGAEGLLGFECQFYFETGETGKILRAIIPAERTEVTEISSLTDTIHSIGNNAVWYETADREKKLEFGEGSNIIYNGVAIEEELVKTLDSTTNFSGFIRVVENGNGTEVIIIEEYADYIVESIGSDFSSFDGKNGTGRVDWSDNGSAVIKDAFGENVLMRELPLGSIITVYESKNQSGRKLVRGTVSTDTVTGTVDLISENKIYINDKPYRVSKNGPMITVGMDRIFALNIYGDIVDTEMIEPDSWQIGLFMGYSSQNTGFSTTASIKIMTAEARTEIYSFAKRVTADGIRISDNEKLVYGDGNFKGLHVMKSEEAIRYRINSDGEVFAIDTYRTESDDEYNDILSCLHTNDDYDKKETETVETAEFYYSRTANVLYMLTITGNSLSNSARFYSPSDATLFYFLGSEDRENNCNVSTMKGTIPTDSTKVWGDFYSTSGSEYVADFVVWKNAIALLKDPGQFVYEEAADGLNEKGEEVKIIKGWAGGQKVEYTLDKNGGRTVSDSLVYIENAKAGDVFGIQIYPDNILYSSTLRLLHDGGTKQAVTERVPALSTSTREHGASLSTRATYGRVVHREDSFIVVKVSNTKTEIIPTAGVNVCKVEKRDTGGKYFVTGIKTFQINVGDIVYSYYNSNEIETAVVYGYDIEGM